MKRKIITDIVFNAIIVLSVFTGMTVHILMSITDGPLDGGGIYTFRYFTNLSNIFAGVISLWILIWEIRMLVKRKDDFPCHLVVLRQISVTSVLVTFATINFIFLPMSREDIFNVLYGGQKIMTHVTTPILSAVAFIFFTPGKSLDWKGSFLSIIPEFLYAILYEIEVPLTSNWQDFYGFTLGGLWYAPFIVTPIICGIAYLSSMLLYFGHRAWKKKETASE